MADVKTRAYYAPYDNDYYVPDAEGAKRTGKNENWRDIEKGFYLVQAKNDEQDGQFADIEAKDEEQDGRLDAIEAKDVEQDGRLDAIEAVDTQQSLDIQTNRNSITALDTRLTSAEALLDVTSQTSVENSAAIAQLQTDQQTLSGRLDTTNAQVADNSTRLTRAENNITSNTQEIQIQGAQISDLEDQAVIRLQATFDRQAGTVTLTDPAAAYDALTADKNAVIELLVDNSFKSIYVKDINNSTNSTYRFTHAEIGVDSGNRGYTGTDSVVIELDTVNETIDSVSWEQVYNISEERAQALVDQSKTGGVFIVPVSSTDKITQGTYIYNFPMTNPETPLKPNTTYKIVNCFMNPILFSGSGSSSTYMAVDMVSFGDRVLKTFTTDSTGHFNVTLTLMGVYNTSVSPTTPTGVLVYEEV